MRKSLFAVFMVFLIVMTACNSDEEPRATATLAPPPASPILPDDKPLLTIEQRLDMESDYEDLRQLHTQISAVWEGLARNENVQCGETFQTISPERFPLLDPLYTQFRRAAVELTEAIELWEGECSNPRATVPQIIIDRGVLRVRGAGDALRMIEEFLTNNPISFSD